MRATAAVDVFAGEKIEGIPMLFLPFVEVEVDGIPQIIILRVDAHVTLKCLCSEQIEVF